MTMAPTKFGLFKARSRDHPEQPSTENLLANNNEVTTPGSPMAASSSGCLGNLPLDISLLSLDYESEVPSEKHTPKRRTSQCSVNDNGLPHYKILQNASADATSISTLHDDDYDRIDIFEDLDSTTLAIDLEHDGASTSCDANSIQFDESSIAPSEDLSVYCGNLKKPKKMRSREEQQLRDFDMWQASNVEVMENLLNRSGNLDEQIKWEAIATARGLCTLTDNCTCTDCNRTKYLSGVSDGDGGLGAAPLFNAISVGCNIQ